MQIIEGMKTQNVDPIFFSYSKHCYTYDIDFWRIKNQTFPKVIEQCEIVFKASTSKIYSRSRKTE